MWAFAICARDLLESLEETFTTAPGTYAAFGALPTPTGNPSTWGDVIDEIGAPAP